MSYILSHIEENPQDTQRLIGLGYPELQQLIQNAERLHDEKQVLLESKKIRIITGAGGRKPKLSIDVSVVSHSQLISLSSATAKRLLNYKVRIAASFCI